MAARNSKGTKVNGWNGWQAAEPWPVRPLQDSESVWPVSANPLIVATVKRMKNGWVITLEGGGHGDEMKLPPLPGGESVPDARNKHKGDN